MSVLFLFISFNLSLHIWLNKMKMDRIAVVHPSSCPSSSSPSSSSSSTSTSSSSSNPPSLITFCSRIFILQSRSRSFLPRREAFLRMKGQRITIHKDEELNSQLIAPLISLDKVVLIKMNEGIYKMYTSCQDGCNENVVRIQLDDKMLCIAFSFLIEESWEGQNGLIWVNKEKSEWNILCRGWIKDNNDKENLNREEWNECQLTLTQSSLYMLFVSNDKIDKRRRIDLRSILSCSPLYDSNDWCPHIRKDKEDRQSIYSLKISMDANQSIIIDSNTMKCLSSLHSSISSSILLPQTSLLTCRLSYRDIPIVVDRAIQYLSYGDRIDTRGIYRVSAKSSYKAKLVDEMIQSPCTALILLNGGKVNRGDTRKNSTDDETRDDVYVVCDALRSFLRSMQFPLIPEVLHIPLFDAMLDDSSSRSQKVSSVLHSRHFPPIHLNTFNLLIYHLRQVSSRSDLNGMTSDNLARIFAPSFFSSLLSEDYMEEITPRVQSLVYLINNYDQLSL